MTARTRAFALVVGLAAAGCHPSLYAESSAPPGRLGELHPITSFWGVQGYQLELSRGIAIAIACSDGDPCEKLVATCDDPAIADIRKVQNQASATVVIVGKAPGATVVHMRTKNDGRDIKLTVVPPPAIRCSTSM
jgi:hypothetical protein